MIKKLFAFVVLFLIAALVLGVFKIKSPNFSITPQTKILMVGTTTLDVMIADTDLLRVHGLSDRENLPENTGMFFIFNKPDNYGFWMKDMKFPIDIIWINESLSIIGVEKNVSPMTFPNQFYPPLPAKYVLEVPGGFFDKHALKLGDPVYLESQNIQKSSEN